MIAFILPRSFNKISLQDKLDRRFDLRLSIVLDVSYVFQIWERNNVLRIRPCKKILKDDMKFVKYEDCVMNTIAIRKNGVRAGKAQMFNNQSKNSHYFINHQDVSVTGELLSYLNDILWEHNDRLGIPSISKQQFIEVLNDFN